MKPRILAGAGIAALAAVLAGCGIKFSGFLEVHEPITFAQKGHTCNQDFDWWNCTPDKTIVVNPGRFTTKATLGMANREKSIILEVENAKPATRIELKFDKNINTDYHFDLKAAQIGQNFDLAGDIVTTIDRTDDESGLESCSYEEPELVCDKTAAAKTSGTFVSVEKVEAELGKLPHDGNFPASGQVPMPGRTAYDHNGGHPGYGHPGHDHPIPDGCHTVMHTVNGNMYVTYHYETTDRDITARFLQGEKNLADYRGGASSTEKIYTYQGVCQR